MNTFLRFLVQTRFQVYMVIQEREREREEKKTPSLFLLINLSPPLWFYFDQNVTWSRYFTMNIIEDKIWGGGKLRQKLNNATRVRAQLNVDELCRDVIQGHWFRPSAVAEPHERTPSFWLDVVCQRGGALGGVGTWCRDVTQGREFRQLGCTTSRRPP